MTSPSLAGRLTSLLKSRQASFLFGGGSIAALGALLLYGQVRYLGIDEQVAFAVQLVVTLALNFAFNQLVTWRDINGASVARRAWKFLLTRGASLALSMGLFSILTSDAVGVHYMAANAVCLVGSTAMNFYTSNTIVFTAQAVTDPEGASMSSIEHVADTQPRARSHTAAIAAICVTALVVLGLVYHGAYVVAVTVVVALAVILGAAAVMDLTWRLYGRRDPVALEAMGFPEPTADSGKNRISVIVCARNEAGVLQTTLEKLALQTHPQFEIIVSLREGDLGTIRAAEAARANFPHLIRVLVRKYRDREIKSHQLNEGLKLCTGDFVGVIDAEDDVAPGLLIAAEAAFQRTGADVVQGPTQLMNLGRKPGEWFCVHNVLEYYFWWSSRAMFQADNGFFPLGGNTVFITRELLEKAGGWPFSVTEDCALGVILSSRFGAKVVAYYDPALATREETPDTAGHLFHQRTRWDTGFGKELVQNNWRQLPNLRQRALAWYTLATPFLQAGTGLLLPVTVVTSLYLEAPTGLVMVTYTPYIPMILSLVLQVVGLRQFGRDYQVKVRIRHYVYLIGGFPFYQWVLAAAAIKAVYKIITGDMSWWGTPHSNKHRDVVPATLRPAEEVA